MISEDPQPDRPQESAKFVRFFDYETPLVFAHRGGSALGPENTLAAFDLGMAAGADGLEFDVHLSSDGVPVVHHDVSLDRTTNATGPLALKTASELARVDAGYRFNDGSGFPFRNQGIGVPTLREVLQRYTDTRLIIEMKPDTAALGDAVAQEVRRAGAAERVCVAGYGSLSMAAARAALPEMASSGCQAEVRTALYRTWARWPVRTVPYGGYQVPEVAGPMGELRPFAARFRIVSPRFLRFAHDAGLKVQIWVVDEEAEMKRLLEWGVDGLISNRPHIGLKVRDAFVESKASASFRDLRD